MLKNKIFTVLAIGVLTMSTIGSVSAAGTATNQLSGVIEAGDLSISVSGDIQYETMMMDVTKDMIELKPTTFPELSVIDNTGSSTGFQVDTNLLSFDHSISGDMKALNYNPMQFKVRVFNSGTSLGMNNNNDYSATVLQKRYAFDSTLADRQYKAVLSEQTDRLTLPMKNMKPGTFTGVMEYTVSQLPEGV